MSGDLPKQVKVKKLAKLKTLDTKPGKTSGGMEPTWFESELLVCKNMFSLPVGIYTAHKMFLQKDKSLIKRLLKGIQRKRPSEVQSAILRRHLLELTQSFIIPLVRGLPSLPHIHPTLI